MGQFVFPWFTGATGIGSFIVGLGLWRKKTGAVSNAKYFLTFLGLVPIIALIALESDKPILSNKIEPNAASQPHKSYYQIKSEYDSFVSQNNFVVANKSLYEYAKMMQHLGEGDYSEVLEFKTRDQLRINQAVYEDMIKAIVPQIIWSILWYQYLSRSRRVKATFRDFEEHCSEVAKTADQTSAEPHSNGNILVDHVEIVGAVALILIPIIIIFTVMFHK